MNYNFKTIRIGEILNMNVYNLQGDIVGSVKDVVIDLNTGNIAYLALAFGGFMSLGEKLFAIPFKKFNVDFTNDCLRLDINEEALKGTEGFDKDNWPDKSLDLQELYLSYGVNPYWTDGKA